MVSNGRESAAQLLARVERQQRAEAEREQCERFEALERQLAAANEKLAELTKPPPLRRSQMSAAEISAFIRSHPGGPKAGQKAFFELPR